MRRIHMNGKVVTCPLCDSEQWNNPVERKRNGDVVATCAGCSTPVTTHSDY